MECKLTSMNLVGLLCAFILAIAPSVQARVRHYKWNVKYEFKSPDCYKKLVITMNGVTPGPTIRAQQGDVIVVDVTNGLMTENMAIHWHGIRQLGTPWADGAGGVSQCPILPGETFTYKFTVDRPGTYMYHGHYGMQRAAGLFGAIHVALPDGESEPYAYDGEASFYLTDWYHKSTYEESVGLSSIPFGWVGEPQSLLIEGKGKFNCSGLGSTACNSSNPECSYHTETVTPGKTYRLRVSSMTSLSALSFQVEGHNLTVVEADGRNVEPFVVQNLFIYSGETYSVLLKADQDPARNYWITSTVVARKPSTPQGLAILNYSPNSPTTTPPTTPPAGPFWDDRTPRIAQSVATKARQGYIEKPPPVSDRVIVMLNTQNKVNGYMRWSVNNVSFDLPQTPYLLALKHKNTKAFTQVEPPNGYNFKSYDVFAPPVNPNATTSDGLYQLAFNSTVDIILQNANTLTVNNSETHPWHLHGHDFWVLGYGSGKFDLLKDPKKYNLENPILKNTVAVHPYGWTAIRFRADNPGAWFFHCHIEAHLFMGMGVVFAEGIDKLGKLPSSIYGCGQIKKN